MNSNVYWLKDLLKNSWLGQGYTKLSQGFNGASQSFNEGRKDFLEHAGESRYPTTEKNSAPLSTHEKE